MINKLTKQQEVRLQQVRAEWFAWGTCTEPANRPLAEEAIRGLYKEAGHPEPKIVIWCNSPAKALELIHALKTTRMTRAQLDALLAAPTVLVKEATQSLSAAWWGAMEAHWVAFYLFGRDELGVKYEEKRSFQLNMWRNITMSACWWWGYANYAIISERPSVVQMNAQERLHCADGPALAFRDGYSVYNWMGVRVPRQVIMAPETLVSAQVLAYPNVEVRRVMIERMGLEKFLEGLNATPIHEEPYRKLYKIDLHEDEPVVIVQMSCTTTGRGYFLRVPPTMTTCQEALAWSFGLKENEYRPEKET